MKFPIVPGVTDDLEKLVEKIYGNCATFIRTIGSDRVTFALDYQYEVPEPDSEDPGWWEHSAIQYRRDLIDAQKEVKEWKIECDKIRSQRNETCRERDEAFKERDAAITERDGALTRLTAETKERLAIVAQRNEALAELTRIAKKIVELVSVSRK